MWGIIMKIAASEMLQKMSASIFQEVAQRTRSNEYGKNVVR
jgi:hypothetical protein